MQRPQRLPAGRLSTLPARFAAFLMLLAVKRLRQDWVEDSHA